MTTSQRICTIVAAVLIAVALFAFHPSGEPGVALRDFEAYYSAGSTWLAHGDPYSLAIWSAQTKIPGVVPSRHEVLPFVGLPATLPFWSLFSRIPYSAATLLWTFLLGGALITIIIASGRLLQVSFVNLRLSALVALAFVPITSDFGLGQAALPAYAFAVFALTTPAALSSVCVALSALQPNVALALLALIGTKRGAQALLTGAIIIYITGAIADGAAWPARYVSILALHANAEQFATIQYTPAAVLYGFGTPAGVARGLATLIAILASIIAVAGAIRAREIPQRFAILCCAIPFVAGFFHEHDFIVMFVPVIFALIYGRNAPLAALATVLAGINWLDFAQQRQAVLQDVTLAAALFIAAAGFKPQRGHLISAIVAIAAVTLGVWLGHANPLPIWPNDMQGAASGATISEVWKNEQLQTGLLYPVPAAALLRTFALLGSALLFYLTLNVDVHHVVERRDAVGMEVL